ncbi:helix-turn-helix transcriptional regulator, partial [Leucobacter sp. M11]|uniref:helix-turn-helix transcriptional regulator n=1 Tax=Leucobacter sp. M11 TaxID=2993565 RepID=UPI002D7F1E7C
LVILVDDVPLLDNMSALVLDRLISRNDVRVVLTCRSNPGPSASLVRATRDGHLAELRVPPLTRDEVAEIAASLLPGRELAPDTVTRMEGVSGGNALFLSELVRGLDRGAHLESRRGIWVWQSPFPEETTLTDVVRAELSALSEPQRRAFETIALSAPAPLSLLAAAVDLGPIDGLVEAGFVRFDAARGSRRDPVVLLAHPIYGESISSLLNPVQVMTRYRELYAAVSPRLRSGIADPAELMTTVTWGLLGNAQIPIDTLRRVFGLTEHLADYDFRIRLASALLSHPDADPELRVRALINRTEAHRYSSDVAGVAADVEQAITLVEELPDGVERNENAIRLALVAADALILMSGQWEQSLRVLDWAEALLARSALSAQAADAAWRLQVARGIGLSFGGRMTESNELQERLYAAHQGDADILPLSSTRIISLAQRGEGKRARALARQQMTLAARSMKQHPLAVGDLVGAWCLGDLLSGNLRAASTLYSLLSVAMERNTNGLRVRNTLLAFGRGLFALGQGSWQAAVSDFKVAASELEAFTGTGSEGLLLASLALAQAAVGDHEGSAATRAEYLARDAVTSRLLEIPSRYSLLVASLHAPDGSETAEAEEIVRIAHEHGFALMELRCLHALAMSRVGGLRGAELARVDTLAEQIDSPLAPWLRDSCRHISAGGDRRAGAAARALVRRGLAIPLGYAVPGLTAREQELAELVGFGFTNAQISKRLTISKRTVESHVARILQKLHVTSREDVTEALDRRSPEPGGSAG